MSRIVLELPSIGWQLFVIGSSQSDSTASLPLLDTYTTRLLTEPLSVLESVTVRCRDTVGFQSTLDTVERHPLLADHAKDATHRAHRRFIHHVPVAVLVEPEPIGRP